jgi:hypothetical protein
MTSRPSARLPASRPRRLVAVSEYLYSARCMRPSRRRIAGTRTSTPALAIAKGGSLVWRCLVRDVTSLGARLEFQDAPVFQQLPI